ncbi:MAG: molecular chaperone DnaJ [Rhodobacterales bacterium CG15_BIG_FIL_POST_REV_8_21_14_020_59_13]|nr:MAG: molecular chaperone DnaJ [Rhodobacterales bacterium CG15_BIG_FIL_POST_REV_8_21_14_020_59_13]
MAVGAGFRPKPSRENPSSSPGSQSISREEALDILGLDAKPTNEEIRAAYRKLMKRVHPDSGGTDGLSRRLTEARDVLLND